MKKQLYFIALLIICLTVKVASSQIYGNWKLVGPIQFPTNTSGQINGIGRVEQIKFDPINPLKIYATSANGGLFVSTDSAATWSSTGTDTISAYNQAGKSAASICIDYTNDSILYLGTGDLNYYSQEFGIWKSTDAGVSWKASNTGMGNLLAVEILMSPHDHNTLIAASNSGIWKSTNAGAAWTQVHSGGKFRDMQFKPSSMTSTIYACTDSDFWVSNDVGNTWKSIPLPAPKAALQNGGRIGVSKADSNVVYVTFVGDDSANCTPLLLSTNSGQTFSVAKPANKCDLDGYDTNSLGSRSQGGYNFCIAIDPTNINTIYVGAESIWKSTDGGIHWMTNYRWWAGIHTDMHFFAFNPTDPTILYNANDGGVWETKDSTATWRPVSNGLSITECYHATTSPIKEDFISIASQDNAGLYYNKAEPWVTYDGGDLTSPLAADYADSNTFYVLSEDARHNLSAASTSLNYPFSHGTYDGVDFSPSQTNVAFIYDSNVYATTNLLTNPPTWNEILTISEPILAVETSPINASELYVATKNSFLYYTDSALYTIPTWTKYSTPAATTNGACIATVKSDSNVVYLSCGHSIYRSANRGASWTNVTANLPAVNIINVLNDSYSTNEAMYLATGDAIWYKDNTMTNWLNYSKGLPATCRITNLMIYNNGTPSSLLRVSFYGRGIWESPLYSSITTGTTSVINAASLKIYPNPTSGRVTVALQGTGGDAEITIYDMLGQNVFSSVIYNGNTELNINRQAPGLYLYKVTSGKGEYISSGKLMIQ
ncbi:MAG: VPS10 domain-containing protein [Bacteroidia bacterium]